MNSSWWQENEDFLLEEMVVPGRSVGHAGQSVIHKNSYAGFQQKYRKYYLRQCSEAI